MYAGDVREALQREVKCRCMLAGRRAPELAAGELERFLDCIQAQQSGDLMDTSKDLHPTQRNAITGDFDKGCSSMLFALQLQLQFWDSLPYSFCGLAHWNKDTARRCAQKCLQQWKTLDALQRHRAASGLLDTDATLSGRKSLDLS